MWSSEDNVRYYNRKEFKSVAEKRRTPITPVVS